MWGDGNSVDLSAWKSGEPGIRDWVARLTEVNDSVQLAGTSSYQSEKYYVCERVLGESWSGHILWSCAFNVLRGRGCG